MSLLFLDDASILLEEYITTVLKKHGPIKVYAILDAKFRKVINDKEKVEYQYFNVKSKESFPTTALDNWYSKNIKEPILKKVDEFAETESQSSLIL